MPHLHLSLQSGDDLILKRMKRRHLRADAIRFCDDVRQLRPDIVFGADLIAGFPTETEAMFENTLSIVEECGLTFLHVFPFSPRAGTPAARMPQVDRARSSRSAPRGCARRATRRWRAARRGGRQRRAASWSSSRGLGRTEHFAPVDDRCGRAGEIVPVPDRGAGPRAPRRRGAPGSRVMAERTEARLLRPPVRRRGRPSSAAGCSKLPRRDDAASRVDRRRTRSSGRRPASARPTPPSPLRPRRRRLQPRPPPRRAGGSG